MASVGAAQRKELKSLYNQKSAAVIQLAPKGFREATVQEKMKVAKILFRSVRADKVSAAWTQRDALKAASRFWRSYTKLDSYYLWSDIVDVEGGRHAHAIFLSHSWMPPRDWEAIMGKNVSYSKIKATELCCISKDVAAHELGDHSRWPEVCYWIDKTCIPQGHPELMGWCVALLEEFIQLSDGLVVILTWSYFERLWCVYEWVCILACKETSSITIAIDPFLRPQTIHFFTDSIKNFTVKGCKCSVESDRAIIYDKVAQYYTSPSEFEMFLKFTAIALVSRDLTMRRCANGVETLRPWVELAQDCGFTELAQGLRDLSDNIVLWWHEITAGVGSAMDLQTEIMKKVNAWFDQVVQPLIAEMQRRTVRR